MRLLKLEAVDNQMSDEQDVERLSSALKELNHPSLQRLISARLRDELLYVFWEFPRGGSLHTLLGRDLEGNKQKSKKTHNLPHKNNRIQKIYPEEGELGDEGIFDNIGINMEDEGELMAIPESQMLEMFLQIAEGIKYLHARGWLHGNIGLSGMFLDQENYIKVGNISLLMNLELMKEDSLMEDNAQGNHADTHRKERTMLFRKDIDQLEIMFRSIARCNLRQEEDYECYTAPFRDFLHQCLQNSFNEADQLICIYIYIYINSLDAIKKLQRNQRAPTSTDKVQCRPMFTYIFILALFYPEGKNDLNLTNECLNETMYSSYGFPSKLDALQHERDKSLVETSSIEDPVTIVDTGKRQSKICLYIIIIILILLLGACAYLSVWSRNLVKKIDNLEGENNELKDDKKLLTKDNLALQTQITGYIAEIDKINSEKKELIVEKNAIIAEKNELIGENKVLKIDKSALKKELIIEIYMSIFLKENANPPSIISGPVTVENTRFYDDYIEQVFYENQQSLNSKNLIINSQKESITDLKLKLTEYKAKLLISHKKEDDIRELQREQNIYRKLSLNRKLESLQHIFWFKYNTYINNLISITTGKHALSILLPQVSKMHQNNIHLTYQNNWLKDQIDKFKKVFGLLAFRYINILTLYSEGLYKNKDRHNMIPQEYKTKIDYLAEELTEKDIQINNLKEYSNIKTNEALILHEQYISILDESRKLKEDYISHINTFISVFNIRVIQLNNYYIQLHIAKQYIFELKNRYELRENSLIGIGQGFQEQAYALNEYIDAKRGENMIWSEKYNHIVEKYIGLKNNHLIYTRAYLDLLRSKIDLIDLFVSNIQTLKTYIVTNNEILYRRLHILTELIVIPNKYSVLQEKYIALKDIHFYMNNHHYAEKVIFDTRISEANTQIITLKTNTDIQQYINSFIYMREKYVHILEKYIGNKENHLVYIRLYLGLLRSKIDLIDVFVSIIQTLKTYIVTNNEILYRRLHILTDLIVIPNKYSVLQEQYIALKDIHFYMNNHHYAEKAIFDTRISEANTQINILKTNTDIQQYINSFVYMREKYVHILEKYVGIKENHLVYIRLYHGLLRSKIDIIDIFASSIQTLKAYIVTNNEILYRRVHILTDLIVAPDKYNALQEQYIALKDLHFYTNNHHYAEKAIFDTIIWEANTQIITLKANADIQQNINRFIYKRDLDIIDLLIEQINYLKDWVIDFNYEVNHKLNAMEDRVVDFVGQLSNLKDFIILNSNEHNSEKDKLRNELMLAYEDIDRQKWEREDLIKHKYMKEENEYLTYSNIRLRDGVLMKSERELTAITKYYNCTSAPEPTVPDIAFYTVHENQIMTWVDDGSGGFTSNISFGSAKNYFGDYNTDGYYVVGSETGKPRVYDIAARTFQEYTSVTDKKNRVCAWYHDKVTFVCGDDGSKVYTYTMGTNTPTQPAWNVVQHTRSLIVLANENVVQGGKDKINLRIIKPDGNIYVTPEAATDAEALGLAEVDTNLVVSIHKDNDAIYLYDLADLNSIPSVIWFNFSKTELRGIAALDGTPKQFAIVGQRETSVSRFRHLQGGRMLGGGGAPKKWPFIDIFQVQSRTLITLAIKKSTVVNDDTCKFEVVKEIKPGFLLVGGNCAQFCYWEYKVAPDPTCIAKGPGDKITGFFPPIPTT